MSRAGKLLATLLGVLWVGFTYSTLAQGAGNVIQLQTKAKNFSPAVYCSGTPDTFLWTWSDGTTSSTNPITTKTYATTGSRTQYLAINPVGVLTNFNIGYDASDFGDTSNYTMRAQQNVGAVYFLQPLTNLQYWASSYNPITNRLDFSGFLSVRDIECWHCSNLQHVIVTNLPSLRRVCFEDCDLRELDLTGNPNFEDLRAALNAYTNIVIAGGTGPKTWHFCVRDNPQITQDFSRILTNFYSLREPWFWNANQSGALHFVSSNLTDVEVSDNHYSFADFTGQSNMWELQIFGNNLTNLIISGCTALQDFEANANQLSGPVIDTILAFLDTSCPNLTYANLLQQSGYLSATGFTHYSHLTNRGVTVLLDFPAFHGPVMAFDSKSLLVEGCAPGNGFIDPGETVTINFALKNTGFGNTTNLVVTLLASNGVASPSGPQSYGALIGGASPVSRPFTFTAAASCGAIVTANLQVQDGGANLGTLQVPLYLGVPSMYFTQGLDSVSRPALPAGWTTSATSNQVPWITVNSSYATAPNSAFASNAANVGVSELVSQPVTLPVGFSQLNFANAYDLEADNPPVGFDGGVLEIKIGGGSFTDILTAGGSFAANGYTHILSSSFGNPLAGRQAWSGNSSGFLQTVVNLPVAAANQAVQFKWRCGTDNANARVGWWIDSISISTNVCCTNAVPTLPVQPNREVFELAQLIVTNTANSLSHAPGGLSYNLLNAPIGAGIDTNGIITWVPLEMQGPGTNTLTTVAFDAVTPLLAVTNSFQVIIYESNQPPILRAQTNWTIPAPFNLVVNNTASDADLPVNELSYVLIGPPTAAIDTNGIITWNAASANVPSTNQFTTIVTDYNPWAANSQQLSATNSFLVAVVAASSLIPPPLIQSIEITNGVASIVCETVPGAIYRLQSTDQLEDTNWVDLLPDLQAIDSTLTLTNGVEDSTQRFYRIFVVP